jgi:ferrous iron transport protein A
MNSQTAKVIQFTVCNPDLNGRILKSDQSGRSFQVGLRQNVISIGRTQGVRRLSTLSDLKVGETAVLITLDLPESVQNHLMHMGFVPDAEVTALRRAPAGDPTVYRIDGLEIALRHETAEAIRVRKIETAVESPSGMQIAVGSGQLREAAR